MNTLTLSQALGQLDIVASAFDAVQVDGAWSPGDTNDSAVTLMIVLKGSGNLYHGGDTMPLHEGQLWLLAGGQQPAITSGKEGLTIASGVLRGQLLDGRSLFDFISLPHVVDAANTELFTGAVPEMLRESAQGGPGSEAIVVCLIRRLVTTLLRDAWPENREIPSERNYSQGRQLEKIMELMNKDPARRYTLDILARAAGMSRTVFHRTFSETYGASPLTLLRKIRLEKAQLLLRQTSLPIKIIASRLGYQSRSYFWQAFKQAYGIDPDSYRHDK